MNLIVNGEHRKVENVATVQDLMSSFDLLKKIVVVEVNRNIIEREQYPTTYLNEGDRIEIVHFVGGG